MRVAVVGREQWRDLTLERLALRAVGGRPIGALDRQAGRIESMQRIEERTDSSGVLVDERLADDQGITDEERRARHVLEPRHLDRQSIPQGREKNDLDLECRLDHRASRKAKRPGIVCDHNLEIEAFVDLDERVGLVAERGGDQLSPLRSHCAYSSEPSCRVTSPIVHQRGTPPPSLPWRRVVLRQVLIAVALAGLAAVLASAAPSAAAPSARGGATQVSVQSLLMPGVSYQREVEYTPHGPVVLDVVIAPRPDGSLYTLAPALSNNAIIGTQTLTDIEKDASATATVVGVNGDFFAPNPGAPIGILMRGGTLDSAPALERSSLGIGADGTLSVARVGFDGTWRGNDQRRQLDLNRSPVAGHTTLYTSAWGPTTPA